MNRTNKIPKTATAAGEDQKKSLGLQEKAVPAEPQTGGGGNSQQVHGSLGAQQFPSK